MKRLPILATLLALLVAMWFSSFRQNRVHSATLTQRSESPSATPSFYDSSPSEPSHTTAPGSLQAKRNQTHDRNLPITVDFVRSLAKGPAAVSLALPGGKTANGVIEQRHRAADGSPVGVTGRLDTPHLGTFFFHVQPAGSPSGPVVGVVIFNNQDLAFRVIPGSNQTSLLSEMTVDQVICRNTTLPPQAIEAPQAIPAEHPTDIPIPGYQNGIMPLQSRPGAMGVLYLDYDGQAGPHQGWGNFTAAAPNVTNAQIRDVWTRVSEDFAPFNLNVTTDLQVFLNAPEASRKRCIVTPTTTAAPGTGGVAFVGSFSWSGDVPCWAFLSTGKNAAETISHEFGHTLGLYHDGRTTPEEYYLGHGTDPVGWAPIMGLGYNKNLTQWSKGEYALANQLQDDLAIIASNTNVGYRPDDAGGTHATAALLDIFNNGTVDSEGTIETRTDVDAFRFTVGNGNISFQIAPVSPGPNLDISASIFNSTGTLIAVSNPDASTTASFFTTLPAGEYTLRIDGTGRGNPSTDGYTDYGSLGQYTITGTVFGTLGPDRFTVAENVPAGTFVGTPTLRNNHAGAVLGYSISGGNTSSAFAIHPTTGAITVISPAVLNFEALSTSWTTPPTFDLAVNVIDSINASLNETLRVVVSITNVNESPTLLNPEPLSAVSRTVTGTVLGNVTASDPDTYDLPIFSIVSGNPDGKFSITPSGKITVSGSLIVATPTTYSLTIRATDQGTPVLTSDITVPVTVIPAPNHLTPGIVTQNIYENIAGSTVNDLTIHPSFPGQPTRKVQLTEFNATTQGTNYGSTVRSWIVAPTTGTYRFWISGYTQAELFFSAAGNPLAATRIAYLNAPSNYQQWSAYGIQQSSTFNLTAGQLCYIEARHKVDSGDDHLSVAWEIKDPANSATLTPRSVIPSRYLAPHLLNYPPYFIASPTSLGTLPAGSLISQSLAPLVGDLEDSVTFSLVSGPSWISLNSAGILSGSPATQDIGTHFLTVSINDGQNPSVQGPVTFTVITPESIAPPNLTIISGETSVLAGGTASYTNLVNNGVLRLYDPAVLNITGTFTNTGVIDIINWSGTLPPSLINTGTILDRSAIRVTSTETSPTHFTLSVPSYQGHFYQLQGTQNFATPWTFIGDAISGTGSASSPPALQFAAPLDGPSKFFRVVVTPAP